jgi:hypothetical protein
LGGRSGSSRGCPLGSYRRMNADIAGALVPGGRDGPRCMLIAATTELGGGGVPKGPVLTSSSGLEGVAVFPSPSASSPHSAVRLCGGDVLLLLSVTRVTGGRVTGAAVVRAAPSGWAVLRVAGPIRMNADIAGAPVPGGRDGPRCMLMSATELDGGAILGGSVLTSIPGLEGVAVRPSPSASSPHTVARLCRCDVPLLLAVTRVTGGRVTGAAVTRAAPFGWTVLHACDPMVGLTKLSEHLKCLPICFGDGMHHGTMCGSSHCLHVTCRVHAYLLTWFFQLAAAPCPCTCHSCLSSDHLRLL